jgi:hypothetical protein
MLTTRRAGAGASPAPSQPSRAAHLVASLIVQTWTSAPSAWAAATVAAFTSSTSSKRGGICGATAPAGSVGASPAVSVPMNPATAGGEGSSAGPARARGSLHDDVELGGRAPA